MILFNRISMNCNHQRLHLIRDFQFPFSLAENSKRFYSNNEVLSYHLRWIPGGQGTQVDLAYVMALVESCILAAS